MLDEERQALSRALRQGTKGAGWYSFDANGVHFIGLVNVVDLKAGGLGNLGQISSNGWRTISRALRRTPIVVFAHIPLWTVYPQWGWGTEDGARALDYLKRFGSVTVLNGHIHQVMQKVEGNVTFHTAHVDRLPAAGARHRALARADESGRRQAALGARHYQRDLQLGPATARDR